MRHHARSGHAADAVGGFEQDHGRAAAGGSERGADSGGTGSGDKHVTGSDDGKGSGRFKISFHEIHSIFSGCNFKNNRFFRINLEFSAKKS